MRSATKQPNYVPKTFNHGTKFSKFRSKEGVHEKWLLYGNESLYYVYHMLYSSVYGTERGCRQLLPATAVTRPQPDTHLTK